MTSLRPAVTEASARDRMPFSLYREWLETFQGVSALQRLVLLRQNTSQGRPVLLMLVAAQPASGMYACTGDDRRLLAPGVPHACPLQ
jgi:hypothetical protein